jgi:FkbM family methyltransferase
MRMVDDVEVPQGQFPSSLHRLERHGFRPSTFIDVGAAEGAFFLGRREIGLFAEARHFFVDAMHENEPIYRRIGAKFGTGYEICAVSTTEGMTAIRIDPNFYNTHIDKIQEDTDYAELRSVRMSTLDGVVERHALQSPFAIKLDVQGGELDALRGAPRALERSIIVTAEIRITNQRDTLVELLSFMKAAGWALFDLTDFFYSPAHQILLECYATFIPERLEFRKALPWARPEEMMQVQENMRRRRREVIEAIDEVLRNSD